MLSLCCPVRKFSPSVFTFSRWTRHVRSPFLSGMSVGPAFRASGYMFHNLKQPGLIHESIQERGEGGFQNFQRFVTFLPHFTIVSPLLSKWHETHFIDGQTEAQRGSLVCPCKKKFFFKIYLREQERERGAARGEREREFRVDSTLSTEPNIGLDVGLPKGLDLTTLRS